MAEDSLLERACELLAANTRHAALGNREYTFSVPSGGRYPFQWFWDSCFHAMVWARIDVRRAIEELRALLAFQDESGLIPHVIFWDRTPVSRTSWHYLQSRDRLGWLLGRTARATALIQPPVIAQAVEAIVEAGGADVLDELLEPLGRYYRYLARWRDPDADGLISTISRFESGLDFSPAYDGGRGPRPSPRSITVRAFLQQLGNKLLDYDTEMILRLTNHHREDVFVNSVYADGLRALERLARVAGADSLESWASDQARKVVASLLERCYDERRGLFFNLDGKAERRGDVKTIISLVPLFLAELPQAIAARLLEHLTDPGEFWPAFPVPSVALDEPTFTPTSVYKGRRLIWRGPCSLSTNWMIVTGLRRHGQSDLADDLAERSRTLVEHGGFNEFYNPLDGAPVGEPRFGWATLAAIL